MAEKRYYWLKLKEDFFQRSDIKIIEGMPQGKYYVLLYLKLLVLAIQTDGYLAFEKKVPYTNEMLSILTNTDIETVCEAIEIFRQFGMIKTSDNSTLYLEDMSKLTGSETKTAQRMRKHRSAVKSSDTADDECNKSEQSYIENRDKSIDIRDKSIENRDRDYSEDKIISESENTPLSDSSPPLSSSCDYKVFGEYKHVKLTDKQHEKLINEFSKALTDDYIKRVDEYCQQWGKTYKDCYLTLRKWIRKDCESDGNNKYRTSNAGGSAEVSQSQYSLNL